MATGLDIVTFSSLPAECLVQDYLENANSKLASVQISDALYRPSRDFLSFDVSCHDFRFHKARLVCVICSDNPHLCRVPICDLRFDHGVEIDAPYYRDEESAVV